MTTSNPLGRRSFLGACALGGAAACGLGGIAGRAGARAGTGAGAGAGAARSAPVRMRKAVKIGMIRVEGTLADRFGAARDAGFDGVEVDAPSPHADAEIVEAAGTTGMQIPGVVDSVHWSKPLGSADAGVRAAGLEGLRAAIRTCHAVGGTSVLLVPAVVNRETPYADAYERSQAEIRKALPLCRDLGVRIAVENVWNGFLLSPLEAARYTDEIDPEWVGWHFDIGNVVNFGWPAHWIRTLGHRVWKLDVKDFSRSKRDNEGLWRGFGVEIGDGDGDWADVVDALHAIGYAGGWAAAEVSGGGPERLREIAARMDEHLVGPFNARL